MTGLGSVRDGRGGFFRGRLHGGLSACRWDASRLRPVPDGPGASRPPPGPDGLLAGSGAPAAAARFRRSRPLAAGASLLSQPSTGRPLGQTEQIAQPQPVARQADDRADGLVEPVACNRALPGGKPGPQRLEQIRIRGDAGEQSGAEMLLARISRLQGRRDRGVDIGANEVPGVTAVTPRRARSASKLTTNLSTIAATRAARDGKWYRTPPLLTPASWRPRRASAWRRRPGSRRPRQHRRCDPAYVPVATSHNYTVWTVQLMPESSLRLVERRAE